MQKIILGFIGQLASGKGTLAKYCSEKYSAKTYRFSTMLRDILDRLYIEKSRENLQKISRVLRENFGQDLMSRVIAEDVNNDQGAIIIVDGVRRPTDITYLETNPNFYLVYITANQKIRWGRLVKRRENPGDETKTFAEFCQDEQAEAEKHIEKLGQKAKFVINNDGSFEDLYKQLEDIVTTI
ncbi:MAG: AAA family ATPase [Candidatus Magasanikbacteria bacterium]|nr:AAA family ATPase [Candidatus Magasanikbacteria bacterium]